MRAGGGNAGQGLGGAPGLGHLSSREGARALGNTIFRRGQGRGAKARWVFPTPPLGRPPPPGFLVPKSKVKLLGVSRSGLLSGLQGRRSALAPPSAALAPPPSRLQLRPDTPRANWRGGGGVTKAGGRNFPALGLRLPRNSFCLRRERGNGKGGEAAAGVRCAAPRPAQTP